MKSTGQVDKFKQALDKQNAVERGQSGSTKRQRDAAEGEAAKHGLGALEKHSKGRPKQQAVTKQTTSEKSPQAARGQPR